MSDGMGRELVYLSSHATNRYFIPNWGPYIQTPLGLYYPKGKIPEYKDGSLDVLELIVQEAICKMLLDSKHRYCCPLFYMCSNSKFQKDECFGTPWTGNLCSFKIISDSWNLNKKEIN